MIEVEKNFDIGPEDKARLLEGATFLSRKVFTDIYYDDATYDLTRNDIWLRKRDQVFQLKIPLNAAGGKRESTDRYHEIEGEDEIAGHLSIPTSGKLEDLLPDHGYLPCIDVKTERESYTKSGFRFDFDVVRELDYTVFEIELLVNSPEEIPGAESRIIALASEHNVHTPGRGKIIEYLLRHNPEHYRTLKENGVLRDYD